MAGEIQEYTEKIIKILNLDQGAYPNENKMYSLDLGDDLVVNYGDLHPGVYMVSYLLPLDVKRREVFSVSLMHLNLFGNGTGGGVIGYDEETKLLTFSQAVPYRLQFEEFKNALEDFINYVEFWKTELTKADKGESSLLTTLN
jgi:hypothetical protein